MKKIGILIVILFFLFWYLFNKIWVLKPDNLYKFSDRDKTTVFPVPKPTMVDPFLPQPTKETETPTLEIKSSTDTSVIKF